MNEEQPDLARSLDASRGPPRLPPASWMGKSWLRNQSYVPEPLSGPFFLIIVTLALSFGGLRLRHCIRFRLSPSAFGILGGQSRLALLISLSLSGLLLTDSAGQLVVRLSEHPAGQSSHRDQ